MEKIAIIEVDARKLKLTIAKVLGEGQYVVLDQIEDNVKLGEDLGKDYFFKANRIAETIKILQGYKQLCDSYEIIKIDCVMLNDCSLAKNLKSFADEIATRIGIKPRLLTEEETNRTLYLGIINTLEVPKGIIVSIGFESTSVVAYVRRSIISQRTVPVGASTLANKFGENVNLLKQCFDEFKNDIKKVEELDNVEPEFQLVGAGEFFNAFAKISRTAKKYSYDKNHNYVMNAKDVDAVFDFFKTLDLSAKQKIRGISEDRADFVAVSVAMIKAVFEKVNVENLVISEFGLTEGLLLNLCDIQSLDKPITDILGHSLESQRLFFEDSMKNSNNIYFLSMVLYKQFRVLHKLPRTFVKVLRLASFFYNAGTRINFFGNSKNSFSVVLNANVFGVSHREQVLAAFVCASQEAVDFNLAEFVKYRDILSQEDLDAVKKLSVIIKIAKGLDKCGSGVIKDVTCDILGDSVILKAIGEDKAEFEIKEALKACDDFKKAYKKNLEIL